ncbi:Uncharacterised protein [Roseomonas gilardii subsp. rosea]|nr:Uncharacterised protein [Roseomonas gilardii subsp. rosea]
MVQPAECVAAAISAYEADLTILLCGEVQPLLPTMMMELFTRPGWGIETMACSLVTRLFINESIYSDAFSGCRKFMEFKRRLSTVSRENRREAFASLLGSDIPRLPAEAAETEFPIQLLIALRHAEVVIRDFLARNVDAADVPVPERFRFWESGRPHLWPSADRVSE